MLSGLGLVSGWSYWASVRCFTRTGLSGILTSASQVVDFSAPVLTALAIGSNPYSPQRWTSSASTLTFSWFINETESQLASTEYAVGVCARGLIPALPGSLRPFTSLAPTVSGAISLQDLALQAGLPYCISLNVANKAQLSSSATSEPIYIDLTPPVQIDAVRDGLDVSSLGDIDFSSFLDGTISGSWGGSFADAQSGIAGFYWCVGLSRGGCDVVPLTDSQLSTTASAAVNVTTLGMSSLHGRTVYVAVTAMNRAGSNVSGISDGLKFDLLPPSIGQVEVVGGNLRTLSSQAAEAPFMPRPNATLSRVYVPSLGGLQVRVTGFNTSYAPLSRLAFSLAQGDGLPSGRVVLSDLSTGPLQPLPLPSALTAGIPIWLNVTATHAAGLSRTAPLPYAIVYDPTQPLMTSVAVSGAMSSESVVTLCASGAGDVESGIAEAYVILSAAGGLDEALSPSVHISSSAFIADPSPASVLPVCANVSLPAALPIGVPLQLTLTLVNGAGLAVSRMTPAFFKTAPPPDLRLLMVPPQQLAPSVNGSLTVNLRWLAASDSISVCCNYTLRVSSGVNLTRAAAFPVSPGNLLILPSGLLSYDLRIPYAPAGRLHFWLEAINSAGVTARVPAQQPVPVIPVSVVANLSVALQFRVASSGDLLLGHQSTLRGGDTVSILYTSTVPEGDASLDFTSYAVRLEALQWASDGSGNVVTNVIVGWTPASPSGVVVFSGLPLWQFQGRVLVGRVKVTSLSGREYFASSPNSTVDIAAGVTAGEALVLGDGRIADNTTSSLAFTPASYFNGVNGTVVVAWAGLGDGEELHSYFVAFGTQPGWTDLQPFKAMPEGCAVWVNGSSQQSTKAYFRCTLYGVEFPLAAVKPAYVTIRALTKFNEAQFATCRNSSLLVSAAPDDFTAWNSNNRKSVSVAAATDASVGSYDFNFSWVPPGGDATQADLTRFDYPAIPSGLDRWEAAVSATADETGLIGNWASLNSLGTSTSIRFRNGVKGSTVYLLVAAVSRAGLRKVASSAPLTLDPTTPSAIAVVHSEQIGSGDVFSARWQFDSLRSGRDLTYTVWLGTCPKCDDLFPPTMVGQAMAYDWRGLKLSDGSTVFVGVQGCNALGVCDTIRSVAGAQVQIAAPVAPPARNITITAADLSSASAGSTKASSFAPIPQPAVLSLSRGDIVWVAFDAFAITPPTTITRYVVAVGDGPGAQTFGTCKLAPGSALIACAIALTEEPGHGTALYATVTAFASSGLAASAVSSSHLLIDRTEPSPFEVTVVDPVVRSPFWSLSSAAVRWTTSHDRESPPVTYWFALRPLGSGSAATPLAVNWTVLKPDQLKQLPASSASAGSSTLLTAALAFQPVTLAAGLYEIGLRAVNTGNLVQEQRASAPLIVDISPPSALGTVVADGPDPTLDIDFITPRTSRVSGFTVFNGSLAAVESYGGLKSNVTIDVWVSWAGFAEQESWIGE